MLPTGIPSITTLLDARVKPNSTNHLSSSLSGVPQATRQAFKALIAQMARAGADKPVMQPGFASSAIQVISTAAQPISSVQALHSSSFAPVTVQISNSAGFSIQAGNTTSAKQASPHQRKPAKDPNIRRRD